MVREGEREEEDKAMWEKNNTRECDQRVLRRTLCITVTFSLNPKYIKINTF